MTNKTIILALVIFCITILAYISNDLYDHESEEKVLYCEMVDTWHDSKGEFGWPDYKDLYETECK